MLRDVDCADFSSQAAAQDYYNDQGGLSGGDPDGLDADHDGVACESNPCPCSTAGPGGGGGGGGEPAPAPPDTTETTKLCGKFRGIPSSRVCLRAVTKGEKLKKGCGDEEKHEPTSTVTVSESTDADSSATQAASKPPKPTHEETPSRAEQAEGVVEDYYAAVDSGDYREAWNLLSPSLQTELGGYTTWREGYATTVATKVSGVHAINVSSDSATVEIQLAATDIDACGDTVDQSFAGTWSLIAENDHFLGNSFDVSKTGGATPVTDASGCGGAGGGVPAVGPAGCDPNYTGCVPPYPPDVDRIDVGQEVEIIGEDVHNLDIGGDGEACEFFLK